MKQIGWLALWNGGYSYAPSWMTDDAEYFPSLDSAKREFGRRYMGWAEIRPVVWAEDSVTVIGLKDREDTRTPAVDESCYMDLYPLWDDGTYGELARRIEYGPRGGMRVIKA